MSVPAWKTCGEVTSAAIADGTGPERNMEDEPRILRFPGVAEHSADPPTAKAAIFERKDKGRHPPGDLAGLVDSFLSGRPARTSAAYAADLEDFRGFVQAVDLQGAIALLVTVEPGIANALGLDYRADMLETRKLAPATINRRLATLRSIVTLAQTLGLATSPLNVRGVKSQTYRDTKGPGEEGFQKVMAAMAAREDEKAIRDRAILRLLFELALRRGEVAALDYEDVDQKKWTVAVMGKGRTEKQRLTLPETAANDVWAWLFQRGHGPGPLFTNLVRCKERRTRITGSGIYDVIREWGDVVGLKLKPHGFRHAGITAALDATGGDVRSVQKFSRHKNVATLMHYDDQHEDVAGQIASKISARSGPHDH